ncbi:MAG TPA: PCP reductase family protein, partial [Gemmatimonadaceae bacterium]|nr:PCP reductase family protein [Gemmatimonadaceae bacterium]
EEAWARLAQVPLVARPLARNTVERFARSHDRWRVSTALMDENKQAMIAADEFDADTMMAMFTELRARQFRTEAEGGAPETRRFAEDAPPGAARCPIRDVERQMAKCPVDLRAPGRPGRTTTTAEEQPLDG